jgi:uncharacterized membrane protein YedE/YeeE
VNVVADAKVVAGRRFGVDRRGWRYLGAAAVGTVAAGLIAAVAAYLVLAGAAVGAWATRQQPIVRWTLTLLAFALVAGTVVGLGTHVGASSTGGPDRAQP